MKLSPQNTNFIVRNKRFDFNQSPRFWCDNNPVQTHMHNAYSLFIPALESFFISVTKEALPLITNETLKAQAQDFIRQEATHSREHVNYNHELEKKRLCLQSIPIGN